MKRKRNGAGSLLSPWQFLVFFVLVAFVETTSFLLFFSGTDISPDIIRERAWLNFLNVFVISAFFTLIDYLRRLFTVARPVQRILDATEAITKGDYSVRIKPLHGPASRNEFDLIIRDFNRMAEELSGTETLRTDFLANVSHEMKTPLSVIRNYSELLQDPTLTEDQRTEYLKGISSATRRFSEMITNMLKLSKLENQQIFPRGETYDLSEQVTESLLDYESVWEERNIDIQADIDEGITVTADRELMGIVWNNLLSNAFKFTDDGGTVGVTVKKDSGHAVISVRDTGCGIDAETGRHIFDKFYQGDTSHSTQGNGLGLALVKRIIDITGSEISVRSEYGKGSEFTVKLPLD